MIKKIVQEILGKKIYGLLSQKKYLFFLKRNNPELYKSINGNVSFYKIHEGKRCFILGNGPSLKSVDLKSLENEIVFSVNCFSRVNNFEEAKPNYHFWMDYSFFELRDDQKYNHDDLINDYHMMAKTGAKCFVPSAAYPFIKENKIDDILDIHYLLLGDSNVENSTVRYKIDDFITGYSTVVQYAITVAIYMGFKEIYLLGCDSTGIISVLNNALGIDNDGVHAYNRDDTNERNKQILKHWTMTDVFFDQYVLFHGYKLLNDFSQKNNILLVNASCKTLVNEIPRKELDAILSTK